MATDRQEYVITIQQAKQIATVKWLLHKAYNNEVPEELREPFYYDKRQPLVVGKSGILHLKPAIVYTLANAELYCFALANIYLDPNYHNLNHCGIIQALARKGIVLSDPQLTETVLLQTSPLKLTAHLCVIEAIMMLYAKEIVTSERVFAAIKKFSSSQQRFNDSNSNTVIPQWSANDYDQLLLLWISETVSALNGRIKRQILETQENVSSDKSKEHFRIPVKELTELCDGVALCALVAYYCPQSLQWQKILVNKPATNADYNHNLNLFYNFCHCSLPYSIFYMSPQDMFPQSINHMRMNLIAMLVDLFNVLEIHPAYCVVSENQNGTTTSNSESSFVAAQFEPAYTRRNGYNNIQKCPLTTQQMSVIPNLRNYSNTPNSSSTEPRTTNSSPRVDRKSRNNSVSESQNEQFVVHKSRNIPTLSSFNSDNCHKERIEPVAAGKPTNWNESRKSQITGGGRRSRRNSFSEDSQLTIENFGGSHENLSVLGRNPDKEPAVHVVKTTLDDTVDNDAGTRQMRCQENWSSAAISSLLRENNDGSPQRPHSNASAASSATSATSVTSATSNTSGSSTSEKMNGLRNFSVPSTTNAQPSAETAEMLESCKVSSQMLNIRLKLEEKRRQIELDKRRMELNLKKQRQKLNKAAFLQAVSKIENENVANNKKCGVDGGGGNDNVNEYDYDDGDGGNEISCDDIDNDSIVEYDEVDKCDIAFSKRNLTSFAPSSGYSNQVEQKWLKNSDIDINGELSPKSDRQTPDSDNIDIEKCQKSISEMDSSLHAIQTDLQWLAVKESEMLQGPENISPHPELPSKPHPMSFMLNQEAQQSSPSPPLPLPMAPSHPIQKLLVNSHQNQNGFYINPVEYGTPDGRGNYNTLPNKNFADYNYPDGYATCAQHTQPSSHSPHHLSLLSTVPAKSPMSQASNQQLINPYDNSSAVTNDNFYMYQMQSAHQPMHLTSHPAQNLKTNYHSINVVDNDLRNTNQFYLHKPVDSTPVQAAFQFHNSSPGPANVAYTPPPPNMTSFSNQRKTWDNSAASPLQSPTHFAPRYGQKEPYKPMVQMKYEDQNVPGAIPSELDYSNYFANNRSDTSGRHSSAGSLSIPSPSADDMAPQCISFIGSQSDGNRTSGNEDQTDDVQLNENMNKLHINNGNRTYRIPSPTNKAQSRPNSHYAFSTGEDNSKSEKGFYVSFSSNDDDLGKPGGPHFADRSPIKVPPRFRKANSNSSISSDRANVKNSPRNRFEQYKKSDSFIAFKNADMENKSLRKQSSDGNDRTHEKIANDTITIKSRKNASSTNTSAVGLVINADTTNDPAQVDEMERKKEKILLQCLQRRQQQEEMKARKEIDLQRRKEKEKQKEEMKAKKKEEEKRRRAVILEKHRLKKAIEEAEREGKPIDKELLNAALLANMPKSNSQDGAPAPKLRSKNHYANRPRPKTIHIDVGGRDLKDATGEGSNLLNFNLNKKGSSVNLAEHNNNYGMSRRDYYRGSQDLLLTGGDIGNTAGTSASSIYSDLTDEDRGGLSSYSVNGSTCGSIGRRRGTSYNKNARDVSLDRATSRIARPKFSSYQSYPRKSSSLMNLCGSSCDQDSLSYNSRYVTDTDSGLGRATPPHRTASPAPSNSSPSGPGSLPPSHHSRRLRYDDTASESGGSEYSGLRLYKQPAVKSNRGIIMNAIEYCVFPGEVNRSAKNRILEEVGRSDTTKHFLVLFRDAKCQFRALYSYFPENEEVIKLYGTGPKQVTEKMFDKFFKYNSGGKCFAQVHTKHLTVTIDAFTIHNSLWQGKKVNLPNKRDMSLVI